MDKLAVTSFGVLGIFFIYWFFLSKKERFIKASGEIDVVVEGGYNPSIIELKKGVNTKLNFLRKDSSSCLEEIVIPDFKIKEQLPLNKKVTIELNPKVEGTYEFSFGMNMYHGKLVVKNAD